MSELIEQKNNRAAAKWQLLASVSALALVANAVSQARAEDSDRPTVWIEAGVQLDRLTDGQESFAPPFVASLLQNPFTPPAIGQKPPLYSFGQEGRITFQPEDSNWSFSAAVHYGRANSSGNRHEETSPASAHSLISIPLLEKYGTSTVAPVARRFATTAAQTHSADLVLDFHAGKDVGLGVFGFGGTSTINAGVRFAQFTSHSKARIDSDPDFAFHYKYLSTLAGIPGYFKIPNQSWNLYNGKLVVARSFTGIGPSLSWDASATLLGNKNSNSFSLDWGLNAAVLFGRQKMQAQHQTMALHGTGRHGSGPLPTLYPTTSHSTARSRSVVVPNLGGFAGFSLRFPNAKVSLGYRADFFFGAMDGGIDARKTYDRGFYGPFATISVGLGG